MVIQFQYDPHGYASALLMLEKNNYLPKPLAVAAYGKKDDLLHRIECMLGIQKKQVISFNKLAGLFAGLLCFIALNALLLLSKPEKTYSNTSSSSLSKMASPYYFFTEDNGDETKHLPKSTEMAVTSIVNHVEPKVEAKKEEQSARTNPAYEYAAPANEYTIVQKNISALPLAAAFPLTYARLVEPVEVKPLKNYQVEQVKEALEASKRVLEEKQWQDVEKTIADGMTTSEKDALKCEYEKELSKVDWGKMKNKLSMAYDKIDWNSVNENLNKALTEIKIDSLHQVYSIAIAELSGIQKELCENNLKGIPDTDISLESVEQTKKNVQKAMNTLNKVRTRKIIHL
jgi:hypothetical protein